VRADKRIITRLFAATQRLQPTHLAFNGAACLHDPVADRHGTDFIIAVLSASGA